MATTVQQNASGRFSARHDDDALLTMMAAIARHTQPDEPTRVSQRRFNANRAAAGHPDCPQAHGIVARLNQGRHPKLSWEGLLELACGPDRSSSKTLARKSRPERELDGRRVYFALRLVDSHLRSTGVLADEPMAPAHYDRGREELVRAERRKRSGPKLLVDGLPTSNQIITRMETWQAALELAGLTTRATAPSAARPPATRPDSWEAERVIVEFVRFNQAWPSFESLRQFAKGADIRMAVPKDRSAAALRAKARPLLVSAGLSIPPDLARGGTRGVKRELTIPAPGVIRDAPRSSEAEWTEEQVLDAVLGWHLTATTGARTARTYKVASDGNPDLPAMRTVQKYAGDWRTTMTKVRKLEAERAAGGEPA